MSERLSGLVVVSEFQEVRITILSSVIRSRSRPSRDGSGRASAYEVEVCGRVHGRERIVNKFSGVNIVLFASIKKGKTPGKALTSFAQKVLLFIGC
jgi:hypothetical protein